jgi:RNA polymerase sigma-70 factor (ECF subfamily)
MTHQDPEIETIARAADGDEMAQRTLYQTHYAAAFRLAYLLLQDGCDGEEVVQDTFVYLFRNLGRYDPARGTFSAWLRVTLVSRCRNRRRRRRLSPVALDTLDVGSPSAADDPAALLELGGAQRAMWEALQQVSPGARDALVLRYYEELPYEEIASVLGCSADAARARVAHGKTQLRRLMTVSEGEEIARGLMSAARVKG